MSVSLIARAAISCAFVQQYFCVTLSGAKPDSDARQEVPKAPKVCTVQVPATVMDEADGVKDAQDFLDHAMADRAAGAGVDKEVRRESDILGKRRHSICQEDTYGEVLPAGAKVLFAHPKFHLGPDDVFYDLGSGLSRMVAEAGVVGGARRAVGVELSDFRHDLACAGLRNVAGAMTTGFPDIKGRRQLEARHDDILKTDVSDATAVFVNNQCFRNELNAAIGQKLSKHLKQGARVASIKELQGSDASSRLIPNGQIQVAVSWDPRLWLYVYKVK